MAAQQSEVITLPDYMYDLLVAGVPSRKSLSFLAKKFEGDLPSLIAFEETLYRKSKELCWFNGVSDYYFLTLNNSKGFYLEPRNKEHFTIIDGKLPNGCKVDERLFGIISTILTFKALAESHATNVAKMKMFNKCASDMKAEITSLANHILINEEHNATDDEKKKIKAAVRTINAFTA